MLVPDLSPLTSYLSPLTSYLSPLPSHGLHFIGAAPSGVSWMLSRKAGWRRQR